MADYIEREAINRIGFTDTVLIDGKVRTERIVLVRDIKKLPAEDVAPVRHGRWICKFDPLVGLTDITCSSCRDTRCIEGCYEGTNGEALWDQENYCPNCGCKMMEDLDGEK